IVISRLWLPALLSLGLARGSLGQFTAAEYAQRRTALLAQIPEGVVLALGAHEPPQDYLSFYQSPSFNYLTGLLEPDAALVMVKSARGAASTLFVEPRVPAREAWVGGRPGVAAADKSPGLDLRATGQLSRVA